MQEENLAANDDGPPSEDLLGLGVSPSIMSMPTCSGPSPSAPGEDIVVQAIKYDSFPEIIDRYAPQQGSNAPLFVVPGLRAVMLCIRSTVMVRGTSVYAAL